MAEPTLSAALREASRLAAEAIAKKLDREITQSVPREEES